LYNGNISSMEWNSADGTNSDYYNYSYDPMNRLKDADFGGTLVQKFDVSNLNYDLNGNILNLTRNNELGTPMDAMSYTYKDGGSNQLAGVKDDGDDLMGFIDVDITGVDDYQYDANGNLTSDLNKGILSIEYNHLNLPVKVTKDVNNYIEYIYDAAGIKLAQMVHQESTDAVPVPLPVKTTYYMGEFIYEQLDASPLDLQLINHEEGRVVKDELGAWEYQYHLKDHLGNVRVTFTTKGPETLDYMATMEPEKAVKEEAEFVNADQRISGQSGTSNTTIGGNYSNYADSGKPVGVGIMLEVAKGDVLDISVNAYYTNATSDYSTLNAIGSALAAAFGGLPGGTAEQQVLYNSLAGAFGALGETANSDPSVPAAYLNYYFFDKDMAFIEGNSGYRRVSYLADGSPEFISQLKTVDNTGFVYVFVSNLSPSTGDERVYFDDLNVKHTKNSKIIQSDDYYPFGLTFNSWQRDGGKKNDYLYNGKEMQDELDLGWMDYGARMYDASIGRFMVKDPLSEKYSSQSAFVYAANNPVKFIDWMGMGPVDPQVINGVYFLEFSNFQMSPFRVNQASFVSSATNQTRNGSENYFVNLHQYGFRAEQKGATAGVIAPSVVTYTIGESVQNGAWSGDKTDGNKGYFAMDSQGNWSSGLGNLPKGSVNGFSGGIPLIINGQKFGESSEEGVIHSTGYWTQNSNSVGKVIVAMNSETGALMIVVSPDELESGGMTLDEIRDRLANLGYNNALSFDGGSSSSLIKNDETIVAPWWIKDYTIPTGLHIWEQEN
ncbi:MAG: phosphodiester glycosidase family protein, partial [Cyclobacteriaceae bacterium]|nr:phosphodiester glycosidase family protein [Cyclobacteriaceae bacterium]